MAIILLSFLGMILVLGLVKIFDKVWWTPTRIQNLMASQGIRGPSYRLVQGNAKDMLEMKKEAMARSTSLSHNISPQVQPSLEFWANMYGKNFLQWLGTQPQLVITELELVKEVLNNKNRVYSKNKSGRFVKKIFGDGLVITEGEKWAKLRKLATHAFHAESLKGMIPAMVSSVEMMLERWKNYEGKEIEVFEEFRFLTSDVISKTAFGSSYLEGKKIFDMLSRLTVVLTMNFYKIRLPIISKFYKTEDDIETDMLERDISNCITEIVKRREEKVMKGEEDSYGNDLLGGLIKAHHDADETKRISVEDLINECKSFYFAGQETTNSLLAWTVMLLAIHTDWQEEARREAANTFGQHNPTPDGIAALKVISMIISESLRLYPPVVSFSRTVESEGRLGNLFLPTNMDVFITNLAFHHDLKIWGEDVHEFKPERFSEGVLNATNNNSAAFFPFGMGPRTCVGMNFALIEAKIALSMILRLYTFTLSPAYVHSPCQLITLQPQHGVQVMLLPL